MDWVGIFAKNTLMRFLTIVLLLAAVSCKNNPSTGSATNPDAGAAGVSDTTKPAGLPYVFMDTVLVSLGAKDFAAVLKAKPNMPILDLRSEVLFKTGHVWRSVNMDPADKDFDARIASFGRNQEYAVYCQSGEKSFKVAEEMKRLGFLRIYHLQRGLNFWGESGQALQLK